MVEIEAIDMGILTKPKPIVVTGIPAFNEERTIASVILEAKKYSDVVIVCDDGSNDLTADIAEELGAVVIRHEKNRGKGWALNLLFLGKVM